MTPDRHDLAVLLTAAITESGWSLAKAASRAGISPNALRKRLQEGGWEGTIHTMRLLENLGVPVRIGGRCIDCALKRAYTKLRTEA